MEEVGDYDLAVLVGEGIGALLFIHPHLHGDAAVNYAAVEALVPNYRLPALGGEELNDLICEPALQLLLVFE